MITIHKFVTEEDVEYYKCMSNDAIKKLIDKSSKLYSRKIIGLPDGDIDILLEQFRETGFTTYCRKNKWNYGWIKVLNNDGNITAFKTGTAIFRFLNKWNQEGYSTKYRIIIDNNNKILWIGIHRDREYFISSGEKIYQLSCEYKEINLFPNIAENEYFDENNDESNDNLVRKYRKNAGCFSLGNVDAKKVFKERKIGASISLREHFKNVFFCGELKWKQNWRYYLGNHYVTLLIDITVKNGLFYITIGNIPQPPLFSGYVLLDLNEAKIIEAGKIVDAPSLGFRFASLRWRIKPYLSVFWSFVKRSRFYSILQTWSSLRKALIRSLKRH